MTSPGVWTPYSTVSRWFGALPSWVPDEDKQRIASYDIYDQIYWNETPAYKLVARGSEDETPIYVPEPRVIIETVNRYVAPGFGFQVTPGVGSPSTQALALQAFTELFARERVVSRFNANKRFGLVRGDWCWHLMADGTKPQGRRLSLVPVDPRSYFPIRDDAVDPDKITKVYLAERVAEDDKTFVKRQTYGRLDSGQIYSTVEMFEEDKWFSGENGAVRVVQPPVLLDPTITAFPVYHVPNFDEPGNPWGSSELRGFERLAAALNQSVSDEDTALALEGLGVYTTPTIKKPVDENGQPVPLTVYPGRILQGIELNRVPGVGSLVPYGDHLSRLKSWIREATAVGDAAVGRVDVTVAESGVALALELGPIIARSDEKDQIIRDVHTQLFYDLRTWFAVYEQMNFLDTVVLPTFGPKLPTNMKAEVELVAAMMSTDPPLMSARTARQYLATKGMNFDASEEALVLAEQAAIVAARTPTDRVDEELSEAPSGEPATDLQEEAI